MARAEGVLGNSSIWGNQVESGLTQLVEHPVQADAAELAVGVSTTHIGVCTGKPHLLEAAGVYPTVCSLQHAWVVGGTAVEQKFARHQARGEDPLSVVVYGHRVAYLAYVAQFVAVPGIGVVHINHVFLDAELVSQLGKAVSIA